MFEIKAQTDETIEVMLYGTISQWENLNAADFVTAVDKALTAKPKTIIFPTHSPGGDVFEGQAMIVKLEAVKKMGIKTICRVDGLCASMMSAFAASCDETEVSPFSRMMVHEARCCMCGTAQEFKDTGVRLEQTNNDLASILSARTGKDQNWVLKNWMSNGKDTWFTPDQAIDAGLADRKTPRVVRNLPNVAAINNWNSIAACYDPYFKDTTESEMNKEQLIKLLGLEANATEAQIEAALNAMKAKAEKNAQPPAGDPAKPATETDKNPVVNGVLAIAKSKGIADEKKLAAIKKLAEVDAESAIALIDDAPAAATSEEKTKTPSITELLTNLTKNGGSSASASVDRKDWGFDDWEKKDTAGFAAMLDKNPEQYIKLFEAKFGYKPSIDELRSVVFKR